MYIFTPYIGMSGYSNTPLFKKLGYKPGIKAFVVSAPAGYQAMLALPPPLQPAWLAEALPGLELMHVFVDRKAQLARLAKQARRLLAPAGAFWVSWPKRASGVPTDITEDVVREVVLPLGLVDTKVCAVDGTWSGLKCVIRKELR